MCDVDMDGVAVEHSAELTARKEHRCYGCSETIRPGDKHRRTAQLVDGEWSTYRHCRRCWAMLEALLAEGHESVQWDLNCGEVWENPPPEIAALAFMTRDEMQRRTP